MTTDRRFNLFDVWHQRPLGGLMNNDRVVRPETYPFTKVESTYQVQPDGTLGKPLKRDLVSLKSNPYYFGSDIYAPKSIEQGGPFTIGRPSFQIGHHMISLAHIKEGGHRIKLPHDGPAFAEPQSKMKLGQWVDLIVEYKLGTIRVSVNGYGKTYEHAKVTIVNEKDKHGPRLTFKGGPNCQIIFDSVHLWECE